MKKAAENVKEFYLKNRTWITFILGFLVVSFSIVPYLYLKEKIWVPIHDNLDAEVLNYIYNAKYLFSDSKVIPEVMNGLQKGWYEAPAPFLVIFYKLFPPFYAYTAAQYFVVLCGYTGMFFTIHEITDKEDEIAFVVASIFCYLPFYNIYGLTIIGQALAVYAFINLYKGKKKWLSFGLLCLFASASSLALAGFAVIGAAVVVDFWFLITGKWKKKINFFFGICLLTITYCLFNFSLIGGVFETGKGTVSHRTEFKLYGSDFWTMFKDTFLNGTFYTTACNRYIIYACVILAVIKAAQVIILKVLNKETDRKYKNYYFAAGFLLIMNVGISAFSALVRSTGFVELRNRIGGVISYFQFDRVSWLLPTSWYILLALLLFLIIKDFRRVNILFRYLAAIILALTISWQVYNSSFIWHHLRLMIFPDTYHLTTWEDIYAEDIYTQIRDYIGKDQSSYRVVSLGIYPSSALYNGFYCLDGYSNNYSLEYKHEFRTIMKDELDRDSTIKQYFDEWGNRCYLMTKESGYFEMLEKTSNFVYKDLEINTAALKEMGGKYIFSAGIIENCDKLGLKLIRDKAFETQDSFYAIYVYEIL